MTETQSLTAWQRHLQLYAWQCAGAMWSQVLARDSLYLDGRDLPEELVHVPVLLVVHRLWGWWGARLDIATL